MASEDGSGSIWVILSAAKDLHLDDMQILRRFAPQNDRARLALFSD
jgi:hypothetical protein